MCLQPENVALVRSWTQDEHDVELLRLYLLAEHFANAVLYPPTHLPACAAACPARRAVPSNEGALERRYAALTSPQVADDPAFDVRESLRTSNWSLKALSEKTVEAALHKSTSSSDAEPPAAGDENDPPAAGYENSLQPPARS